MNSSFSPMKGFSNAHLQTVLPSLLNRKREARFVHEVFELADGDFLDLAWHQLPSLDIRPLIVIFHGLAGSVRSPYAFRMMEALDRSGFNSVVMHFRGCFKEPNRLARAYHSGETGDAKAFLGYLVRAYPGRKIGAVGYSLGGNMLIKLQGELGDASPLFAAVSVSAPIRLEQTADFMNRGVSRFYQKLLVDDLKKSLLQKFDRHDYAKLIGLKKEDVYHIKSFWEYDDLFTGPIHGFNGAAEYYEKSSGYDYLFKIAKKTLVIHALDDPFMPPSVLPNESALPPEIVMEVSRNGGHVGFVGGSIGRPLFWLEKRIPDFFGNHLLD
ncbi:hydrolase [Sulfurimonas sp. HSL3-7]|uniref:hydrolase n=1 Tax=Sulfonitrofixus jiaomeiensis TaxID=3131938 RepID=UPI0031F9B19F